MRLPVVMSYASSLLRGVRLVPGAAPAGRALLNRPPANTVLPTTACDHTTPSICTVGSASGLLLSVRLSGPTGAGAAAAAVATNTPAATIDAVTKPTAFFFRPM